MKKVMITVMETKIVEMEKEISDEFYEALNGETYEQNIFDDLEDECIGRMDSCEFDDADIDKDAGIMDIVDEDGYELYHWDK